MKRILVLTALALLSFTGPGLDTGFGEVNRQMGVGIYICAVPARDYDTVCTYTTRRDFNSYPGPSIPQRAEGIRTPVDALAYKAVRRARRKKDINAIITFDGKTATAVKFTGQVSDKLVNKAKVNTYKGYGLYIQNKPAKTFDVVANVKLNTALNLEFTGYNSIAQMLDSLIYHYEKKYPTSAANAIVTQSCVEAQFITIH